MEEYLNTKILDVNILLNFTFLNLNQGFCFLVILGKWIRDTVGGKKVSSDFFLRILTLSSNPTTTVKEKLDKRSTSSERRHNMHMQNSAKERSHK